MGQAYNEDYIQFGHKNNFSNKLFSAWDYHITDKDVAVSKHITMKRHFEVGLISMWLIVVLMIVFRKKYGIMKKRIGSGMSKNGLLFL